MSNSSSVSMPVCVSNKGRRLQLVAFSVLIRESGFTGTRNFLDHADRTLLQVVHLELDTRS